MPKRVTAQDKTGRSATPKPLDERIDRYQGIGSNSLQFAKRIPENCHRVAGGKKLR